MLELNSSVINNVLTSAGWRDENPQKKTPALWVALVRILQK